MKKVIALVLALLMVFGLAACGNGGGEAPDKRFPRHRMDIWKPTCLHVT